MVQTGLRSGALIRPELRHLAMLGGIAADATCLLEVDTPLMCRGATVCLSRRVYDRALRLPFLTVPVCELNLLDGVMVVWASVDFDGRNQKRQFKVLDAGRLFHDVFSTEVVTTLLQNLNQGLRY